MQGVFSRLDEHSAFAVGDVCDTRAVAFGQAFGGVGIELAGAEPRGGVTVVGPVLGSPAWHAGIAAGARILAIDGQPTGQMTLEEACRRLRGEPGTAVTLSVATSAPSPARDVSLVREILKTESVLGDQRRPDGSWEWMVAGEPGVALVRITAFGDRTAGELRQALDAIAAGTAVDTDRVAGAPQAAGDGAARGMLIIDLRGNAGGQLAAAVEVCDIFLDDGVIVSTRGRRLSGTAGDGEAATASDVRRATRGAVLPDLPMAILVDGLTAHVAEVVAACLQDQRRAIVVGSRTFGQGTVQSTMPLSDGSGVIRLTTAEYIRPSGASIHRHGNAGHDDAAWGVSPDPGGEIAPTARQFEAWQDWRRHRDRVPAKGEESPLEEPQSHAVLPRRGDPVLAKAIDAVRGRE